MTVRSFGAATLLNGFVFVLFLIAGEADVSYIIGTIVLTALAEIIRYLCKYDTLKGVRLSFISFAFSFFAYTATFLLIATGLQGLTCTFAML